jgi:3-aminobutyryl-CoA ammonia-lyase
MSDQSAAPEGRLRIRFGLHDTHYPGGLIPAATILRVFADCAAELGIRMDGVDGYLAAYEHADFLKPLYAGDYVEFTARLQSKRNRSRRVEVAAHRYIEGREHAGGLGGGTLPDPPELVARATMVVVLPRSS